MRGPEKLSNDANGFGRRLTRRTILRYSFLSAAAITVAAACQSAPTPAPTTAPAAAPTTPPAAKPTTAPAAAPTTAPAAAATSAPKPAAQAPAVSKTTINGKFTVVQARDFHPDHNAFIEAKVKEFAQQQGWALDHSYIDAF